jgi:ATP-binding cassette, subfamily B (MDR/TAP), member 1
MSAIELFDKSSYQVTHGEDLEMDAKTDVEANVKDEEKTPGSFSELLQFADGWDYLLMFGGSIGGLVTGCSIPFFNVLFGRMLDTLNEDPNSFSRQINALALIFVYTAIVNLFSGFLQVACWSHAGERMSQKLRERYVKAILSQEIGWFDLNGPGEMATKVADLSGYVQDGTTRKVGDMFQYVGQFLASFVVGFYLCWELTLVLLAAFPLIGGAGAFMINAITSAVQGAGENYASAGSLASEALNNIRTVTALNAQPDIISRYRLFLIDAMHIGISKGRDVGLGNGAVFGAAFLTYGLGFWYGAKLIAEDKDGGCTDDCITGGTILAVFFAVIMGSIALGQIVPPLNSIFTARASVGPMMKVINRVPEIDGFSDKGKKPAQKSQGNIEIKELSFAYPSRPDIQVCTNYNVKINAGETVALVGASGSGKSTIVNLLLRFYDPYMGFIKLDGTNIKDLNVKWLRSQIGYVGQEPVLFSGSIRDNIAYGLPEESLAKGEPFVTEAIEKAARTANAYEFIKAFPEGFATNVGTGGIAMSGGQKQRIAIARALVKNPSILLLDEATSALDATSERVVQRSIDELQKNKSQTVVVIAHRLSTIRGADKICVVNRGAIAETGNHDDLMAKNGLYADLIRLQTIDEVDEGDVAVEEEEVLAVALKSASVDSNDGKLKSVKSKNGKEEEELDAATEANLRQQVFNKLKQHWAWGLLAIAGAATFGAMFPCWGLLLAKTQDMFYYEDTNKMQDEAEILSLLYVAMAFIALTSSTFQFWGSAQVCEAVSMEFRSDLFQAILRREIAFFDKEENDAGSLTTRLSDDSRTVTKALGESIPRQLQAMFTLLIGLGIGLSASWKLALVVIATFPVSIVASAIQMQALAGQQYGDSDSGESAGGIIGIAFTNMRTVCAFSMQYTVSSEYDRLTRVQSKDRQDRSIMGGVGHGAAQASMFCTYALLFWYGAQLIEKGEIKFEAMMTAILSLMLGALGLGQALTDLGDQKNGLKIAKKIFDACEEGANSPIDGLSIAGKKPEQGSNGEVVLELVNFRYPTRPKVQVCHDYSLSIKKGEVVALVGPSGGGKSTIMNLLLRFYDPASGEIRLDGVPLKDLNVRWLRSQIGYVGQEPVLFSGSVSSNIAKGRVSFGDKPLIPLEDSVKKYNAQKEREAKGEYDPISTEVDGEQDIIEAATASNAHEFISDFTEGYNTDVGEGSIMVSGGQKQRIAIARALIRKPAILLLDEATSALDAQSERLVQASIDKLQESKAQTTIVIAHRLTTIRNATKIAVIDKGHVVQVGDHDTLLQDENGLYHELWSKQQGNKGKGSSANLAALNKE